MKAIHEQIVITPYELIEKLKTATKSTRKHRSLDLINEVCAEQNMRGSKDFSIVTISKLSEARGGPKAQSIRNINGADYRAIISCWAKHLGGQSKKTRREEINIYDRLLVLIPDPAVRAAVGAEMAEVKRLRRENSLLKQSFEVIVDQRPIFSPHTHDSLEPLANSIAILKPSEIESLTNAIAPGYLNSQGWVAHQNGKVTTQNGRMIFLPGFVSAIQKILSGYDIKNTP